MNKREINRVESKAEKIRMYSQKIDDLIQESTEILEEEFGHDEYRLGLIQGDGICFTSDVGGGSVYTYDSFVQCLKVGADIEECADKI